MQWKHVQYALEKQRKKLYGRGAVWLSCEVYVWVCKVESEQNTFLLIDINIWTFKSMYLKRKSS